MDLAVLSFGDLALDAAAVDDARALIPSTEPLARRRMANDAVRSDVAVTRSGEVSAAFGGRTNRNSFPEFLAASGNPLEWVLCVGRPANQQASQCDAWSRGISGALTNQPKQRNKENK
jgi:hypothetical protein